jgi:hypothetical protein
LGQCCVVNIIGVSENKLVIKWSLVYKMFGFLITLKTMLIVQITRVSQPIFSTIGRSSALCC